MAKHNVDKHGNLYADEIKTPSGRAAWTKHLLTPKPPKPGKLGNPKYELTLVLDKGDAKVNAFLESIKQSAKSMFEQFNKTAKTKLLFDEASNFMFDGDASDPEAYPFYVGKWVLLATNRNIPVFIDTKGENIEGSAIKGGMVVKMMIVPYLTQGQIRFRLEIVQFIKDDGVRFAGGVRSKQNMIDAMNEAEETLEPKVDEALEKAVSTPNDAPPITKQAAQKGKQAALARL